MNFILNAEPRHLWYYDDAYKIRQKELDNEEWKLGMYFASALNATVGNMFSKKRNEYVKEPFMTEILMSESEKRKKTEEFFANLQKMQADFEAHQRDKVS